MEFTDSHLLGSVQERLRWVVENQPHAPAVRWCGIEITFAELDERTDRLAAGLVERLGTEREVVPFLLEAGLSPILAVLAILKAGKIYCALEPGASREDHEHFLESVHAKLVLTDCWSQTPQPYPRCLLEDLESHSMLELPASQESDPAAVIFTSGTTGPHKPAVRSHGALLHRAYLYRKYCDVWPGDRQALLAGCHSVASETDVFGSLLNGATLCPFPSYRPGWKDLEEWLESEHISLFHPPVAFVRHFAASLPKERVFPYVRLLTLSGEAVCGHDWKVWKERFPNSHLMHRYSSSETGNIAQITFPPETKVAPSPIPAGQPCEHKQVIIKREDGTDCEPGEVGEIFVRSPYLFLGYWPECNQPEEWGTGDRGFLEENGVLYVEGRADQRKTVHGMRVDLSLVERVLLSHPDVTEAAVWAEPDDRLLAQVGVPPDVSNDDLRKYCEGHLPPGHCPDIFERVDGLPLNLNGKVDRLNLHEHCPLRNQELEQMCELWSKTLKLPINPDDNFFDHDGTSLTAAQIAHRLEEIYKIRVSPSVLSEAPTPNLLLDWIKTGNHDSLVVRLRESGTRPPLFLVHSNHGMVLPFYGLSRRLGEDQPLFAFRARGLSKREVPHADIPSMAVEYVAHLRRQQPDGPYYLGGHCLGGVVAFEMARILVSEGEDVAKLILIDSMAPTPERTAFADAVWRTDSTLRWLNKHLTRPRYIAGRLARRVLTRRFSRHPQHSHHVVKHLEDMPRHLERLEMFHSSAPSVLRPVLIVSDHEKGRRSETGWKPFFPNGYDVHRINGVQTELLQEPFVREVARIISEQMP